MIVPGDLSPRASRLALLLVWIACAGVMLVSRWPQIETMTFSDPDDALRFVEVRDWLAGQAWSDLSQYRGSALDAVPMHWSRLVDIPLAALMTLARLIFAPAVADRVALTLVPLLTLLALAAVVFAMTRKLTGRRDLSATAVALLMLSPALLTQFRPLRIDHHGWQIVLGALAVLAALDCRQRPLRAGLASGLAMAVSLVVAIEGLPLAVGIAGVLAFDFIRREAAVRALVAYTMALTVGGGAMSLAMLGWPGASLPWCDALSPAYLGPMAASALVLGLGRVIGATNSPVVRIMLLGGASAAGAAAFICFNPQCAAGPFSALDPLVRTLWYENIQEGLPIWMQAQSVKLLVPIPSLLGLAGTLLAIRQAPCDHRALWTGMLLVQIVAFAVSMMVLRALGIAHVLALPGCAVLVCAAFRAARSIRPAVLRVILSVATVVVTPIGAQGVAASATDGRHAAQAAKSATRRMACVSHDSLRGLDALPRTVLFTPVDIGSHLIAYTRHEVIATGHHRNRNGMKAVISAFTAPPAKARAIIAATPARYIAFCPGEDEIAQYARRDPQSLMAALIAAKAPEWLRPIPMRPGEQIRVYRILRDQPGTKASATPFMQ